MSITYGFYDSINGDRKYNAEQVSSLFDGFVGDGIHMSIGGRLIVKASSGMKVLVSTGRAWFNHTWTLNDAEIPFTVPAASSVLNRIDAIVLTVNTTTNVRVNSIDYLRGTEASNPVRPSLQKTGGIYQYALAYINIKAGMTEITQSAITNMVGSSDTPFVTGLAQIISVDQLIAQWETEWQEWFQRQPEVFAEFVSEFEADMNEWKNTSQVEFDAWKADAVADFDDWFENLHIILDGDVAAHLQNEIDHATGSIVNVVTDQPELYGKTVQLDGDNTHMSTTFDASGNARFKGVTDTGYLTLYTDDADTEVGIEIPYYGYYTFPMQAFRATINITLETPVLKGKPIHVTGPAVDETIQSTPAGQATYIVKRPGKYTFSVEYDE